MSFALNKDVNRKPWRLIALLLAFGVSGFLFFLTQRNTAFPEASIDLKISRVEISNAVDNWARKLDYPTRENISSLVFSYDDNALSYLQNRFGAAKANLIAKDMVPIWYWASRRCKEYDPEKIEVDLSPSGKLVRISHEIPNDRELVSINHEDAKKLAESFLEKNADVSLSCLKLVEDDQTSNVKRTDHSFVWESTIVKFGEAKPRFDVSLSGNKISKFHQYLYVPETWKRQYQTMRTYNSLLSGCSMFFVLVISIWGLVQLFRAIPLHQMRYRFVITSSALVAFAHFAYQINELPSELNGYDPLSSFAGFLALFYLKTFAGSAINFVFLTPVIAVAETLYRSAFPERIALENVFNLQTWKSPEMRLGILVGYAFFGISLGYQTLFYMIGSHFGVTSPLGVSNYAVLASTIPAVAAIAVGVMASVLEESFRVIGLGFGQRFFKSFWLANLLQAMVWGFAHSCYPQQPAYARGLELTIAGLAFGWILRRYGLGACIVSHFLFDAYLTVQPMFAAPDAVSQLSAYVSVLFLSVFTLVLAFGRSKQSDSRATMRFLLNSDVVVVVPGWPSKPVETPDTLPPKRISKKLRWAFALVCIIYFFVQPFSIWNNGVGYDTKPVMVNRNSAISIAQSYMHRQGVSVDGKTVVAYLTDGLASHHEDIEYVHEKEGLKSARAFSDKNLRPLRWVVRFFKPLDTEDYFVSMDGQGQIITQYLKRAENAPGAHLSRYRAQQLAENYIRQFRPDLVDLKFSTISETKRENRTDFDLEFVVPSLKVGDADFKVNVAVIGDQVSGLNCALDIPDNWKFEHHKKNIWNEIGAIVSGIVTFCFFGAVGILLAQVLRDSRPSWKLMVGAGVISAVVASISWLNNLAIVTAGYSTTTPWSNFQMDNLLSFAMSVIGGFMTGAFIALVGILCMKRFAGGEFDRDFVQVYLRPRNSLEKLQQTRYWIDACLIAASVYCANGIIATIFEQLHQNLGHGVAIQTFVNTSKNANVYSGALEFISQNLSYTISYACAVALALCLNKRFGKKYYLLFPLIAVHALSVNHDYHHLSDYLIAVSGTLVRLTVIWLVLNKIACNNLAAYLVTVWVEAALRIVMALGHYALPLYAMDFILMSFSALMPFLFTAFLWFRDNGYFGMRIGDEAPFAKLGPCLSALPIMVDEN